MGDLPLDMHVCAPTSTWKALLKHLEEHPEPKRAETAVACIRGALKKEEEGRKDPRLCMACYLGEHEGCECQCRCRAQQTKLGVSS